MMDHTSPGNAGSSRQRTCAAPPERSASTVVSPAIGVADRPRSAATPTRSLATVTPSAWARPTAPTARGSARMTKRPMCVGSAGTTHDSATRARNSSSLSAGRMIGVSIPRTANWSRSAPESLRTSTVPGGVSANLPAAVAIVLSLCARVASSILLYVDAAMRIGWPVCTCLKSDIVMPLFVIY